MHPRPKWTRDILYAELAQSYAKMESYGKIEGVSMVRARRQGADPVGWWCGTCALRSAGSARVDLWGVAHFFVELAGFLGHIIYLRQV